MRNIKIVLEYDGTEYAGWQVQPNDITVQGTLIEAVKRLTCQDVKVTGASRTDAGVHACGQAANFLTNSKIPLSGIQKGLNSILPPDIVVKEALEAPAGFDARRSARSKSYLYRVMNRDYPTALERRYCWFVSRPLDMDLMRQAARHFPGKKDFSSFRAAGSDAPHSIREITSLEVAAGMEGIVEFRVRGTAFLRHMVRIIAGTLVEVGLGRLSPGNVEGIIEARDRSAAPRTAPARGLFLQKVEYV